MKISKRLNSIMNCFDKHSGGIIAIFTFVLACATIFYVIYTYNILRQNKRQVEITNEILLNSKKQSEITNRPYVAVGTYNVTQKPNDFSFELSLINVGPSPAAEVMLGFDWSPISEDWILSQKVDGKTVEIKRRQIQHIYIGAPTTIFPKVILVKKFGLGYNHTIEYWLKKYRELSLTVTIYYRGIEPKKQDDFYKTKVQFVYKPHKKGWDVERSEVY